MFSLVLFGFHPYTYPNMAVFGDIPFSHDDFRIHINWEWNYAHWWHWEENQQSWKTGIKEQVVHDLPTMVRYDRTTHRTIRHRLQHIKRIKFREGARSKKHTQQPPGEPEGRKRRFGEKGISRILSEIIFFNTLHAPSIPPSIPPHREINSPCVIG